MSAYIKRNISKLKDESSKSVFEFHDTTKNPHHDKLSNQVGKISRKTASNYSSTWTFIAENLFLEYSNAFLSMLTWLTKTEHKQCMSNQILHAPMYVTGAKKGNIGRKYNICVYIFYLIFNQHKVQSAFKLLIQFKSKKRM